MTPCVNRGGGGDNFNKSYCDYSLSFKHGSSINPLTISSDTTPSDLWILFFSWATWRHGSPFPNSPFYLSLHFYKHDNVSLFSRMEHRKQPDRKSKTKVVGEVQELVSDYQEVGSFTPRPFLKTEQIMVDPPQIKTEPEEVFPEVGINPGCIKCKQEEGEVDCKNEPGQVKMEPVSPVSDNSETSTLPLPTIPQEGERIRKEIPESNPCDTSQNRPTALPNEKVSGKRKSPLGTSEGGSFEC